MPKAHGGPGGTQILSVHQRVRFRGPPRQGLRPHLRRDRRPVLPRRPQGRHRSLGIRVACETLATTNRVVIAGEVARPETRDQGLDRARRAHGDPRHRLRAGRLPLGERRDRVLLHAQSADIAQGVDAARQQGRGRRRPGHHVRLRLQRDAGADAGADLLRAQDPATTSPTPATPAGAAAARAPTPRARSPCATRTASRSASTQIVVSTPARRRETSPPTTIREIVEPYVAQGAARGLDHARTRSGTSTRPASSSSAARTATAASPAARSSSTPTAARRRMAAAPSPARIRPRSTARPPMRRAISPRTSSPPASPTAAPSSSPTRSAWPSRCRSMSTPHGTGKVDESEAREGAAAR